MSVPDISSLDWSTLGSAIMYVLVGAGTAVIALWRRRRNTPAAAPPVPHDSGILITAALAALRDAEEAMRSLRDSNLDTQMSLASQLGALRELVEDIHSSARALRRLVAVQDAARKPRR